MTGLKPGRKNPFITAVTHQIYFIWLCSARLTLPEWHIIYSRLWECSERSQHGWLPLILWKPKVQLRGGKNPKRFGLNIFPETLQMELDVKTILDIQLKFTNTPCYILYFKTNQVCIWLEIFIALCCCHVPLLVINLLWFTWTKLIPWVCVCLFSQLMMWHRLTPVVTYRQLGQGVFQHETWRI